MNKTLQQWQDYNAKKMHKFPSFNDIILHAETREEIVEVCNKAAESYAIERCEVQKEICHLSVWDSYIYKEYREDVNNSILNAPNACDKTK